MTDSKKFRPTDAELAILRVLWNRGPATVREVWQDLSETTGSGYTTVLKMMQIMTEKKLVQRDESQRAHVYSAQEAEEATQKRMVTDFVERVFDGSAARLVAQALSGERASAADLAEIRQLIDRMEVDRMEGDDK